jgi:hypothetical protein
MVSRDIKRALDAANEAMGDYVRKKGGFKRDYPLIIKSLLGTSSDFKVTKDQFSEPVFELNIGKSKSAFLIANFFGNEVYASLSLLFCLENQEKLNHRLFAVPLASKVQTKTVDESFKEQILCFLKKKGVDDFVVFSQGHPYLDGFYIKIPSSKHGIERAQEIIDRVKKHHEVGAFSARDDKPTYTVVVSENNELISRADQMGIMSFEFVISKDILAGYQALLQLLSS